MHLYLYLGFSLGHLLESYFKRLAIICVVKYYQPHQENLVVQFQTENLKSGF